MESLRNKVAIITGASAGIGEGTAVVFAQHGCYMTLTGRDESRLKAAVQRCVTAGCPEDKIATVIGDLRNKAVQQEILDKTLKTFGRVDILVNNAGLVYAADSASTTEQQYDETMDVNVKAVFFLSKLIAPELIKTKGNIVNVSSLSGSRPMADIGVYCMSKAALDMFTQCLALELAPKGVRVNSVNPGSVVSMVFRRGNGGPADDEEYAKFVEDESNKHPIRGMGQPEDIGNTIAFLVSDMSWFTTGSCVFVDGGRHCL